MPYSDPKKQREYNRINQQQARARRKHERGQLEQDSKDLGRLYKILATHVKKFAKDLSLEDRAFLKELEVRFDE